MRSAGIRPLGGIALITTLLTGVGSGLFHVGHALARTSLQHADMLSAGVDMMPLETVKR